MFTITLPRPFVKPGQGRGASSLSAYCKNPARVYNRGRTPACIAGRQSRSPRVKCLTNGELWQDEALCAVRVPHPTAAHGQSAAAEGNLREPFAWVLFCFAQKERAARVRPSLCKEGKKP